MGKIKCTKDQQGSGGAGSADCWGASAQMRGLSLPSDLQKFSLRLSQQSYRTNRLLRQDIMPILRDLGMGPVMQCTSFTSPQGRLLQGRGKQDGNEVE